MLSIPAGRFSNYVVYSKKNQGIAGDLGPLEPLHGCVGLKGAN